MVDVCMITYNHETFIAQAIEGVMMQQTSFPVRLVLGEDGSKDNTRAICIEYQKKYPDRILLLTDEGNLGMNPNFMRTLKACTAKYVALCEGDDYWTDPQKLQKQVDFMEANPDYMGCFGNASYRSSNSEQNNKMLMSLENMYFTQLEIVLNNPVLTLTTLYRNRNIELDKGFLKIKIGDWIIWSYLSSYGNFYYFNENWATYRVHSGGVFSNIGEQNKIKNLSIAQVYINKLTKSKFKKEIENKLYTDFLKYFNLTSGDFRQNFLFAIKLRPVCGNKPLWFLIDSYLPRNKVYFLLIAVKNKFKNIFSF